MIAIKRDVYYYTHEKQDYTSFNDDVENISLRGKGITSIDLNFVISFQSLNRLDLGSNDLTYLNLSPLKICEHLEYLDISFNKVKEIDLSPLANCKKLEELDLLDNQLEKLDFSCLVNHPRLSHINLTQNRIRKITLEHIGQIPRLTTLDLRNNRMETIDIEPLANCSELMNLELHGNSLTEIDLIALKEVTSLRKLEISGNKLEKIDLDPLSSVKSLEILDISGNRIKDVDLSPLANCYLLKGLYLTHNQIQELDISPLIYCPNLQSLEIDKETMVSASSQLQNKRNFPKGIRDILKRIVWFDIGTPTPPVSQIRQLFIKQEPYTGLLLDLVQEINRAFFASCFVCTAFLSRKLIENILISIMTKKYGSTNPEYYMEKDKQGNFTKTKIFHKILEKFWSLFRKELLQYSPVTDNTILDKIKETMFELKDNFNVDVHQIGSFRSQESLLNIRNTLEDILKFLLHILDQIN